MLKKIVEVRPIEDHRLFLRFENGIEGIVDLRESFTFEGVFSALNEPEFFNRVRLNSDFGVVEWPNGADLDSDVLYAQMTGGIISCAPSPT